MIEVTTLTPAQTAVIEKALAESYADVLVWLELATEGHGHLDVVGEEVMRIAMQRLAQCLQDAKEVLALAQGLDTEGARS